MWGLGDRKGVAMAEPVIIVVAPRAAALLPYRPSDAVDGVDLTLVQQGARDMVLGDVGPPVVRLVGPPGETDPLFRGCRLVAANSNPPRPAPQAPVRPRRWRTFRGTGTSCGRWRRWWGRGWTRSGWG